jgi:predicted DNA-binding transcriptional regulator YafY
LFEVRGNRKKVEKPRSSYRLTVKRNERLYWIDERIRAGRFPNAQDLQDAFDIPRSTAFEDRKKLIDLGAPLGTRADGRWFYTEPGYSLKQLVPVNNKTREALRLAVLAAQEFGEMEEAEALRLLAEQVMAGLGGDAQKLESVAGAIRAAGSEWTRPDLLADCRTALRQRRRLWIRYWSAHNDEETERTVRPLHLRHFRGEAYLICWCEKADALRDFFLTRIRDWRLEAEGERFSPPEGFDVAAYLSQGWEVRHGEPPITVRVRLSPWQARWARERKYHATQTLTEREDGGVELTMTVSGTFEIRRWILSLGAEAEVLEPESLRREIAEEIQKLGNIYASPAILD